jgi:hypothetical protein
MNPEEIQELLVRIQEARAQGFSDADINRTLRRSRVPFRDVADLERTGRNLGVMPEAPKEPGLRERVAGVIRPVLQGATFGLGSDFLDLTSRLGLTPEGAGETFREGLNEARRDSPVRSALLEVGGAVAGTPGAITAKVGAPIVKGAANLASRGASAVARAGGQGAGKQLAAGGMGRTVGGLVSGGAVGGAEGALYSFGSAAGEEDRGDAARTGAVWGTAFGAPLAGLGSVVGGVRQTRQGLQEAGRELTEHMGTVGKDLPTRRAVAGRVAAADAAKDAAFAAAESAPPSHFRPVVELALTDRTVRNALRRQDPAAWRRVEAVRAGKEGATLPDIDFNVADDIRKHLKFTADQVKRRAPDAKGRPPQGAQMRQAEAALERLEEAMAGTPGLEEGLLAHRVARGQERFYEGGRRAANQPAEVATDLLSGTPVRRGNQRWQAPRTPEDTQAFRAGMAEPLIQKLRSNAEGAAQWVKSLPGDVEGQEQLRLILGSDEAVSKFITEAQRHVAAGDAVKVAETLIKTGGFLMGTSLIGAAALRTGLFGPSD